MEPTGNSSKPTMLQFLRKQDLSDVHEVASIINCDPVSAIEVPEEGSMADMVHALKSVDKATLWNAIEEVFFDEYEEEDEDGDEQCDDDF